MEKVRRETEAIFGVRAWAVPHSKIGVLIKCLSTVFLETMTVSLRKASSVHWSMTT
jgi:hypothetical protein